MWKTARVKPIVKKDKTGASLGDFRPISLLPNIGKLFEVFLNKSINRHCDKESIIPDTQFGFRYKHSAVHAVNKFVSHICWALNNKEFVGACLIDLEKAFDTVWLDGLFYKLLKKNSPNI